MRVKKKAFRAIYSVPLVLLLALAPVLPGQDESLDSLILGKGLKVLDGVIPAHYSAPCEQRAREMQAFLAGVAGSYAAGDGKEPKLRLAVLDEAQWAGMPFPYGFFFIDKGWIVIPGDLTFRKFSRAWGFEKFSGAVRKSLELLAADPEELGTDALYKFALAHELGHDYCENALKAAPPDPWSAEWLASYFATGYLSAKDKMALDAYDAITAAFRREYEPRFRTLLDFDAKYDEVGLENYVWYHFSFQPMIEDIHARYGEGFLAAFARAFPKGGAEKKLSQEELLRVLDGLTEGRTSKWVKVMEGAPPSQ
jgi:hypothetical protein